MKKLLLLMSALLSVAMAQGKSVPRSEAGLSVALEKQLVQAQKEKPYYANTTTAALCEEWNSCVEWATKEYANDKTFRVEQAYKKTRRITGRHVIHKETYLYVQAVRQGKTIYVMFTSPYVLPRRKSYQYIASFPKDVFGGK